MQRIFIPESSGLHAFICISKCNSHIQSGILRDSWSWKVLAGPPGPASTFIIENGRHEQHLRDVANGGVESWSDVLCCSANTCVCGLQDWSADSWLSALPLMPCLKLREALGGGTVESCHDRTHGGCSFAS